MKLIIRTLYYLSKFYLILSFLAALILAITFLGIGSYYIALFKGSELAKLISESSSEPATLIKLFIQNSYLFIFQIFNLLFSCFLTSKILKSLRDFFLTKLNHSSSKIERSALSSMPKYITIIYILGILISFLPNTLKENNETIYKRIDDIFYFIIPDFGSALGLLFALVIYYYSRDLNENETAKSEIDKLKKEADLVI